MWADGRGVEVLLGQGKAALQPGQTVLVIRELLPGHQVDTGQLEQGLQALVTQQACLLRSCASGCRAKSQSASN